jgi:hypothetical protein
MDINRAALLDELVKIGEAQEASSGSSRSDALKRGLKVALKSGLGYGAGMGVGELIGRHPFFSQPNDARAKGVKIILPILMGSAVVLSNELRKMKDKELSKVPGYSEGQSHAR